MSHVVDRLSAISGRHLRRRFKEVVGISPKYFARIVRFHQVASHIENEKRLDFAHVAAQYGYADQAHLIREFRQFSGKTPLQFAGGRR